MLTEIEGKSRPYPRITESVLLIDLGKWLKTGEHDVLIEYGVYAFPLFIEEE